MKVFMVEQPKATEKRLEQAQKDAEAAAERLKAQGVDIESLTPQEIAREAVLGGK